jgi:hypothetical protein
MILLTYNQVNAGLLTQLGYTYISKVVLAILRDLRSRVCPNRSAIFFIMAQLSSSFSIQTFALIVVLVGPMLHTNKLVSS